MTSVFTHTTLDEYEIAAQINDKSVGKKKVEVPRDVFAHLFVDHSLLLRECGGRGVSVQQYTGPKIQKTEDGERPEGISRGIRTRVEDDLAETETAGLVAEAKRLGYTEKSAPNEGIRRMRLLNVIRARRKKEKK